jgi:endonuclease/exonuclease/phosphatase (EEP) superfamily protein YafD
VKRLTIQPVAQQFAGLEEWDVLLGDLNAIARPRVAAALTSA